MNLISYEKGFLQGQLVDDYLGLPLVFCAAISGNFQTGNHFYNGVISKTELVHAHLSKE